MKRKTETEGAEMGKRREKEEGEHGQLPTDATSHRMRRRPHGERRKEMGRWRYRKRRDDWGIGYMDRAQMVEKKGKHGRRDDCRDSTGKNVGRSILTMFLILLILLILLISGDVFSISLLLFRETNIVRQPADQHRQNENCAAQPGWVQSRSTAKRGKMMAIRAAPSPLVCFCFPRRLNEERVSGSIREYQGKAGKNRKNSDVLSISYDHDGQEWKSVRKGRTECS